MAPTPITCSATGCSYNTPMGAELKDMLEFMKLHTQQAHPPTVPEPTVREARATTKVDKRPRPVIQEEMSEHDWRFFQSEWKDYTRATGVTGQHLLDELWSCMSADLRRLAFNQGSKEDLDTEQKMMERIRGLAVSVLHAAVHTVALHEARQSPGESTKAFAARVRGTATNCNLVKACECSKPVSFLDETVYHVVLAGLHDSDMQERALSAAILKTITDTASLVEFCSAEESGRKCTPTVAGFRGSTFQRNKHLQNQPVTQANTPVTSRCDFCGGKPHSSSSRDARANECKAWNQQCKNCSKTGHFAHCCKGGKKTTPKPVAKNAAMEDGKKEEDAVVEAFAFCSIVTSNRFEALSNSSTEVCPPLPSASRTSPSPGTMRPLLAHRKAPHQPKPNVHTKPAQRKSTPVEFPIIKHTELPLPGHTAYPPPPYQSCELAEMVQGLTRSTARIPLCHMEYRELKDGTWDFIEMSPEASPQLTVRLALHEPSYTSLSLSLPVSLDGRGGAFQDRKEKGVADTGAMMDITSEAMVRAMGIDSTTMIPVKTRVFGATSAELDVIGAVLLHVSPPSPDNKPVYSTVRLFYVARNVSKTYLSLSTLKALHVVEEQFPRIPPMMEVAASTTQQPAVPTCTNDGVVLPGEKPCSCPKRDLPPPTPASLPCSPTEENLLILKQFLLDRYSSSAFNVCENQTLPMLQSSPPLELHVDPSVRPVAVHRPAVVPIHWREAVEQGLQRDIRLGVIEEVPLNTPVTWQSRMHITAKHDGSPRRTVDYQALNDASPRQTHHTSSPWHIVSTIPEGVRKSCFDAFHGYHSLPLASEWDREATTFITEFGRFRYLTCPQGFLSAGDAYTDRMDRIMKDMERQRRCVDDTLLYDQDIKQSFFRACQFLDTCAENGIVLNPKKFQFAEKTVEFLGFTVSDEGVRPTDSFVDSILNFPTPTSLTDIRSWFGAVAQVSYSFATSPAMLPFKHLLSSKTSFSWSPELEKAFKASKQEVVDQCMLGVRTFDPSLPTALSTDWCKTGMGFWLCQKRCQCLEVKPGCCPQGWQTVYVGSRFCNGAESRYHPICGEARAAAYGVEKCRFFLLGMPDFLLCLDHRPLLKIFSPSTELGAITNPRLYNQKMKLLPYRFTPVFIPGKAHVTADCYSRRSDFPEQPDLTSADKISLLDIENVQPEYSSTMGPPSWVSQPASIMAALSAHPADDPTLQEADASHTVEQEIIVAGNMSIEELYAEDDKPEGFLAASLHRDEPVRMVTWARLQLEVKNSPQCQSLMLLMSKGLPEDKVDWPEALLPYYPYRQNLLAVDGVILCGERPLIPPSLRGELVQHLHAAHQGVTKMLGRAAQTVFWPGLKADITAHRESCRGCVERAPSNPAPPPSEPVQPDFPFSHIVADFFTVDATYLALADRYSNWLSIFKLKKDDSEHVIEALRRYFSRWGVAVNITTDGASVFTSAAMKVFLSRWGVQHRVSSAYYPRANKRAEVGVKSAKRLVMDNLGPGGSMDTDKLARALLVHRNCPDAESGLSAAQIIFGRELRDHLPALVSRYQPRQEWRLEADLRAQAMARRHGRMEKWLQHGARALPPLNLGDTVAIQDQAAAKNGKAGRWNKSGVVVEILPHDSYLVKVHGNRSVTQRNRRFLRKLLPFKPINPVEDEVPHPATRPVEKTQPMSTPDIQQTPLGVTTRSQRVKDLPNPSSLATRAASHRRKPLAKPGEEIVTKLKNKEQMGSPLTSCN